MTAAKIEFLSGELRSRIAVGEADLTALGLAAGGELAASLVDGHAD